MPMSLGTICIRPQNFDESIRFYRDMLGLKPTMECFLSGSHEEHIVSFKAGKALSFNLVKKRKKAVNFFIFIVSSFDVSKRIVYYLAPIIL